MAFNTRSGFWGEAWHKSREKSLGSWVDKICYFAVLLIFCTSLRFLFQQYQSVCISYNALRNIRRIYAAKSPNPLVPIIICLPCKHSLVMSINSELHTSRPLCIKMQPGGIFTCLFCIYVKQNQKKIISTWHSSLSSNFMFQNNY